MVLNKKGIKLFSGDRKRMNRSFFLVGNV